MGRLRLNAELEAEKRKVEMLTGKVEALQQELDWMVSERNKLHRVVQAAREGFTVMCEALYPDHVWEINPEWSSGDEDT